MFGALSVAELGAMMPDAGGQYVYLREAYGPFWGFLYGWTAFAVINTASIAAVAVTFATYLGYFFPLSQSGVNLVAIASILLLTIINCFGIKIGATIQNGFTLLKIAALLLLVALSFILSGGSFSNFSPVLPALPISATIAPVVLALIAVLWSYDGWIEITYVAGEVINPQKNLPRALGIGTLVVIAVYLLVSCAVMYVLPMSAAARSSIVLSDVAVKIMGSGGALFISAAVVISTFGTNNGFIFTSPWIYYAMAKEGLFFGWLASVHPRFETPIASLLVQGALASLLILTGSYDQLITYVVFASFLFYAMSANAVILLRKRSPELPRGYRAWGFPVTPTIFVIFAIALTLYTIAEDPRDALIGSAIMLAGMPLYFFWKKKWK